MAAIITEKFRMSNADIFKSEFGGTNKYYMFLGKSAPWSSNDAASATDSAPPAPADDVTSEMYYWDDMIAAKDIGSGDVSFVAPRRNWAAATTFDMYEHDISAAKTTSSSATNIFNSTFYFVTSAYRIYKVLDNGKYRTGAAVAIGGTEPTSEVNTPFESSAGTYVLQYINTISASEATKFLTTDFMPISTNSTVSAAATDGSIVSVRVTSKGSSLTNGTYYAAVYGDGTSAGTASGAIIRITVAGNVISDFGLTAGTDTTMHAVGAAYTYGTINLGVGYTFNADATLVTAGVHMGTGGTPAIEVIISPKGGHGFNATKELGAHYVMMNTTFSNTDVIDVTQANDFRRIGLVKNPYAYGTTSGTTYFSGTTARQTRALYFDVAPTGTYVADEKITQAATGAVGKVVEWNATKKVLFYTQERFGDYGTNATTGLYKAFDNSGAVVGAGGASGTPGSGTDSVDIDTDTTNDITFTDGVANPEIQSDHGDVIYVENRKPITRTSDQTEDIKIIVEF
jgi:hypothetical protein